MILFSDYQGKVLVLPLFSLFSHLLMYIIMTLLWRINKLKNILWKKRFQFLCLFLNQIRNLFSTDLNKTIFLVFEIIFWFVNFCFEFSKK